METKSLRFALLRARNRLVRYLKPSPNQPLEGGNVFGFSRIFPTMGIFAVLAVGACGILDSDPEYREYKILADSIQVPASATASESLPIRVFAELGNGCHSFSHFQAEKTESRVDLVAWGRQDIRKGIACDDILVMMDETHIISPPYQNPFQVAYDQPDGATLSATVAIQGPSALAASLGDPPL